MADTRPKITGPAPEINYQVQQRLNALVTDVDRISILADDRGALGDGTTDDATALQSALDELNTNGGGVLRLTPGKSYVSSGLLMRSNVIFDLNQATLLAKSGANNQLFAFSANVTVGGGGLTPISLSSATQGSTSITVSSSASFVIGERIMISAGTFTGSGVEEGPIEFNTVTAKPDGTHITVLTPLKYNYSGFGLPGAAGAGVYRVDSSGGSYTRGNIHDVRITNGTIKPFSGFNGLIFNGGGERIELDHLVINDIGSNINSGGYLSNLRFHDNVVKGTAGSAGGGMNFASLVESWIEDNYFIIANDASTNCYNSVQLEVTCHDNVVARNTFGPKRSTSIGAVEVSFYGFNNKILDNRIWGLGSDVSGGTGTIGIRTYSTSGGLSNLGNVIAGNLITDIMQGIGDILPQSIILGNTLINSTSHANSQGIILNNDKGVVGHNTVIGFTNPFWDGSSAVPRVSALVGDRGMIFGNGSPESVVTAPVGMAYIRRDGGVGTCLYLKESGTGNTGWKAMLSAASIGATVQAWDTDLDAIAALAPANDDIIQRKSGAWTNRTMSQLATDLTTLAPKASPSFTGVVTSGGALDITGAGGSAGASKGQFSEASGNISINAYGVDTSTPGAFLMGCLSSNGSVGDFFEYLSKVGVLKIGTSGANTVRGTTEGTLHLDIFNGTAPVGTLTNGISLYCTSGELRVMDSGGTATLLSQHAQDAPEWFYDDEAQPSNVSMETNCFAGKVRFINFTRQARLQQLQVLGEKLPNDRQKLQFIHEETFEEYNSRMNLGVDDARFLMMADWDIDQDNLVRHSSDLIAEWEERKQRHDAALRLWELMKETDPDFNEDKPTFNEKRPALHVKREKPQWLKGK